MKEGSTSQKETELPEQVQNPIDRPRRYYCADKSGILHWGNTEAEAQLSAAEANREMGNFDPQM